MFLLIAFGIGNALFVLYISPYNQPEYYGYKEERRDGFAPSSWSGPGFIVTFLYAYCGGLGEIFMPYVVGNAFAPSLWVYLIITSFVLVLIFKSMILSI